YYKNIDIFARYENKAANKTFFWYLYVHFYQQVAMAFKLLNDFYLSKKYYKLPKWTLLYRYNNESYAFLMTNFELSFIPFHLFHWLHCIRARNKNILTTVSGDRNIFCTKIYITTKYSID
ncbi:28S ribosomal protein S21, partial [Blattella germanica]